MEGAEGRTMLGRDRELARVSGLLNEVLAGHGRLVLCTGEAGIGKTRLAEELATVAATRGVPAAWARATDQGSLPPYGLWRLLFDEPAVPAFMPSANGFGDASGLSSGADSGSDQRFGLFTEIRRRLVETADPTGLLVVLDDLQWADEASGILLTDLVRHLGGTRILVFASYRTSPTSAEEILVRLSAEANAERVDLRGLSADVVAHLVRATGLPASPEQVEQVVAETDGNPFLVQELARMLVDQPRHGSVSVPGRVVDATSHRLTQVSPSARTLLQAAAVAGNSFSVGVVARMLDVPVFSLLGPLQECGSAGFVVPGDQTGTYRFSHALIGSAVVARLSIEDRRLLHTAAADAIGALYEGQMRLRLAEVARHRVEASRPGFQLQTVAACEAAADVAAEETAYEDAVRLYRQALSVGGEEIGEVERDRLELALAATLQRAGDLPGAQETATRVGRRAERRRDRVGLALTAVVMEATGVPAWDGEICRLCEQALGGELPMDLRARVSARYAQALVYRGHYDRAGKVSQDALAAAEEADDPTALIDALRARQLACCGPEGLAERIVLADTMMRAADAIGSAWAEMWGRLWRIDTLFETGQLREIPGALTDLDACLDRVTSPVGRFHYLEGMATLALATGRFAEAARRAREAFEVFSDMGHPVAIGALAVILSQSCLHIGLEQSGLAEAFELAPAEVMPEVVDTTQGTATIFPALTRALIHLHQADPVGAQAAYALAGPLRSWTPSPAMRMAAWGHALPLAIAFGFTSDIEYLLAQLEPFRGQHAANGAGPGVYMGPVELHTGLAAAALGRLDPAATDLQTAVSICDANGARGYAVQARVEFAAVLTRRQGPGDASEAAAAISGATGEAEQLGMLAFTNRIEQLRDTLATGSPIRSPLSRRESEVASLIGRGRTNKQIAESLYVSERTAENHVQHILVKLGFNNRSQIAAWSSRQSSDSLTDD